MSTMLIICFVLLALLALLFIRNELTYRWRIRLLTSNLTLYVTAYTKSQRFFPDSYMDVLFNLRIWTYEQFLVYSHQRAKASGVRNPSPKA